MTNEHNLIYLDQIASLKENWNAYGAKSFSVSLIETCKTLLNVLEPQPEIFPTGRGSIQFQYELEDGSYLEFEIFEKKVLCLEIPRRIYSNARFIQLSISEITKIKEIVKRFYEK